MAWQCVAAEVTVKGSKKCSIYPMQWMGLIMICYGMAVKRIRMLGVSVRKMKALTVTPTGKGR